MTDTNTDTTAQTEPQNFSVDYVRELRAESKGYRLKAQELEQAAKTATEAAARVTKEAEAKIAEVHSAAQERVIRAELKAVAVKHGIVDLDGLKLLDVSKLSMNEHGDVEGGEELIEAAKKAKPWLFSESVSNSSSTAKAPKPAEATKADARQMSEAEIRALERQFSIKS